MKRRRVILGLFALAFATSVAVACASDSVEVEGTNTNWLQPCSTDDDCGTGICDCGFCTTQCVSTAECAELTGTECATALRLTDRCAARSAGLCVLYCESGSDCSGGATCVSGLCREAVAPTDTPCNPARAYRLPPVGLDEALAIAEAADGTLYAVDQNLNVFVSSGEALYRKRSGEGGSIGAGTGPGGGATYNLVFEDDGRSRSLWVATTGEGTQIAVVEGGARMMDFAALGDGGELLSVVDQSALGGLDVVNLPVEVAVELSLNVSNGDELTVIRPAEEWGIDDLRLFYGAPDDLVERDITSVTRDRDDGSLEISFQLGSVDAVASLPAGQMPTLTVGGEARAVTPKADATLDGSTFFCDTGEPHEVIGDLGPGPCPGPCDDPRPRAVVLPRPVCPENPPVAGEPCDTSGLSCGYGGGKTPVCRELFECTGTWTRTEAPLSYCPDLPAGYCPAAPPALGDMCTISQFGIGVACEYSDVVCRCTARFPVPGGAGNWACFGPPSDPECPATLPNIGEGCATDGVECWYDVEGCLDPRLYVVCQDGAWTMSGGPACLG